VYRVRSDEFWNQLETDSEFTLDYLRCVLRYNLILVDRIAYQNEKGIRAKVSKWLLFMSKYYGENDGNTSTIYIPLTQETISEFLHCSRESVSITLAEMTREGIVSTRKKLITIHDLSRLSAS
jgi:CRP-like cAMP-binding protein